MNQYVGDSIPENTLRQILQETIAFDIPLVPAFMKIFIHWNYFMGPRWLLKMWVHVL